MAESLKVSARERRFVEEYLVDHNGSQSMLRAGFTGTRPDIAASKCLARPRVQQLLEKRIEDKLRGAGIRSDRVLTATAEIAYGAKYEPRDRLRGLELLGRNLKLWTDRTELTGKDGAPLTPPVINIGFANGGPGG